MPEDRAVTVDLARLWGDFREFRGEMRTRMDGLDGMLSSGLRDMRDAVSNHRATEAKVTGLEQEDLARRIGRLEGNWRIAIWIGAAIAVMVFGLVGEAMRSWMFG